ncbi:metallophosphoesterase [Sebaldella sp. S0638]|uniref:metallophosphoesterase family protein n=1 Tax=Sebaldella sp. S0638 TaxID=2957809 RepID=UPI00209D0FA0|nr:metallophosphoesterase [Sebaldella sp. S0638]
MVMKKRFRLAVLVILLLIIQTNIFGDEKMLEEFKIAFISDAHFHDVYADFEDESFDGLKNSITGKNAKIRTMEAELTSTRLFNENYYALTAALDNVAEQKIKYVGLAGDFSDDGQIVHIRGLKKILDSYTDKYGIQFFAVMGNHDPVKPVDNPNGKSDFLGKGGMEQRIFSKGAKECVGYSGDKALIDTGSGNPTVCTQEILELGYEKIAGEMGKYGFMPQKEYLYWATPYSSYNYDTYTYEKALAESPMAKRKYEECLEGTGGKYKKNSYTNCFMVGDPTYLVEPVKGIWILAIDANVYLPVKDADMKNPGNPSNFEGSGNAGYNKMITHKAETVEWIAEVVKNAEKEGKTLITFSHFPMIDFYDNNQKDLEEIFGKNKLDLRRLPTEETTEKMAQTGVRFNVAGHLHFNDTGVRKYGNGDFLVNIQVPSLAAYVPGYKILTMKGKNLLEVETVEIKDVPRFDELFEHYREEHKYLSENKPEKNWDIRVLDSKNYGEFTDWHLIELTRKRFLPQQWPEDLRKILDTMNGKDILTYSELDSIISVKDLEMIKSGNTSDVDKNTLKLWKDAEKKAQSDAKKSGLNVKNFEKWNGFDLAVDFYRFMNADELALKKVSRDRIKEYSLIYHNLEKKNSTDVTDDTVNYYYTRLFRVMYNFTNDTPSDRFIVDFNKKEITDLSKNTNRMK